jgi:hypothetical protein
LFFFASTKEYVLLNWNFQCASDVPIKGFPNLFAAFAACNPQRGNVYSNLGGFPNNASSQLITDIPNTFKEVITLNLGTDIESGGRGYLSNEGLKKIENRDERIIKMSS